MQRFTGATKTVPLGNSVSNYPSWGRRRRSINKTLESLLDEPLVKPNRKINKNQSKMNEEEEVHELLRVYLSQEDVPESQLLQRPSEPIPIEKMCLDKGTYYLLLTITILFILLFIITLPYCILVKWLKSRYEVIWFD